MKLTKEDKELIVTFLLALLLALVVPASLVITCTYNIVPNLPCNSIGF